MSNKFIYNSNLDDITLDQLSQFEETEKTSLDEPTYRRLPLDSRDLEILIDCLEAGAEAYEDDADASERIEKVIAMLKED